MACERANCKPNSHDDCAGGQDGSRNQLPYQDVCSCEDACFTYCHRSADVHAGAYAYLDIPAHSRSNARIHADTGCFCESWAMSWRQASGKDSEDAG
jgi:hypothetical protein